MDIKNVNRVLGELWAKWDVRGLMLLSLSLQTLLLLLAPLRKRSSNNWLIGSLLCFYMLADWTANYAAGVITNSEGDTKNHKNKQPLAFWSTFLLVHLGGPDSITAFTLQDNDFWHRHALSLGFQCISATYIFFKTLPQNRLWLPTLLMFVCGFIKCYERTRSLYSATFNNLRDSMRKTPDPGPSYVRMMGVHRGYREARLPTRAELILVPARAARVKRGGLRDSEVVLYAHQFFHTFKRLLVDLKCSYYERIHSREFFLQRTSEDAFKVIELELNFMYDILFTKASVVYNPKGSLLRLFSSALLVTSFGLFYHAEKIFRPFDVTITYALLLGVIALDVIAFIQFITSNWLTAFTEKLPDANWLIPGPTEVKSQKKPPCSRRWSGSVSTHNLIDYCLRPPQPEIKKFMDRFGLSDYFEGLWYVTPEKFTDALRDHIFDEVRLRSKWTDYSEIFEEAIAARGEWTLRLEAGCEELLPYVHGMDYDQSLLSWHIATDLCWSSEQQHNNIHRDISKLLSDYMMYLVVMQPTIMHGVTDIEQRRLRDTQAEIQKEADPKGKEPRSFIRALMQHFYSKDRIRKGLSENRVALCTKILGIDAYIEPHCIKGDKSKSVLFDGCRLAQVLESFGKEQKWEIMSKVWVEMLTYAAVHCRPQTLAQQLSKGGELISFVWLLMAHFGLVDHFEAYGGLVRAKLIVEK